MLLQEINESLSVHDLFDLINEEYKSDQEALQEIALNTDGSVEWEAPTAAEKDKFSKDKMVPQHGETSTGARMKQLVASTPVPGDFVQYPNVGGESKTGIIISLDMDKGLVTVIDKDKKPLGTLNIKDLKLSGRSKSPYRTVYSVFKNEITQKLAPEDQMVKRFMVGGEVRGQG